MFRKSKTEKLPPPPPSIEEILSDLDGSLHIENKAAEELIKSGNDNGDTWWADFQQFMKNLKAAVVINSEINAYIPKLEDTISSLDSSEKRLQKDIDEQQAVISDVLEKASSA